MSKCNDLNIGYFTSLNEKGSCGVGFEVVVKLFELATAAFVQKTAYRDTQNYKELYLLYLKATDVIKSANLVSTHYLKIEWDNEILLGSSMSPIKKWSWWVNKDFDQLTSSVNEFLEQFGCCYHDMAVNDDEIKALLGGCFEGKIPWKNRFIATFDSGTMTPNGAMLISKSITLPSSIADNFYHKDTGAPQGPGYRLVESYLDMSTKENRDVVRASIVLQTKALTDCAKQIRKFILDKVSIEQLLS